MLRLLSRVSHRALRRSLFPAAVLSVVVILSALADVSRLVDVETGLPIRDFALTTSWRYRAGSPLFAVLDQLSLLTSGQHVALLLSLAVCFLAWRVWRSARRQSATDATWLRRIHIEFRVAAVVLASMLGVYAFGALAVRPMARLRAPSADDAILDFHSHTDASHDGRRGFTLEANRAWHAAAGYDVAYVTDHARGNPSPAGAFANPARAGDGAVLLRGVELVDGGAHVVGLSSAVAVLALKGVSPTSSPSGTGPGLPPPVVVQTLPQNLTRTAIAGRETFGTGVTAIELVDAAPRGLEQSVRDRQQILRLADRLNLAVVASSNNHGWGRTAAAWSVLRVPGWRADDAAQLATRIERVLSERRRHAVRVVARRGTPVPETTWGLAFTMPNLAWTVVTTLSPGERFVWIGWVWFVAAVWLAWAARRPTIRVRGPGQGDVMTLRGARESSAVLPPSRAA